ncbi:MAG TPA: PhaM family polyhydroxyalkanoate granule multifunctional regulatory protein [Macromonas sp.]|nr:PhaM family polyhydroxyalkanoate granule multifunctional regulatory protein [Macromonas sp.]
MSQPDLNAFAKYIPGFEFLQNLTRQAAGTASPDLQSGVPGMPPLSHWVAPTFDVEELDKRIQDLKAVHFWLDQNTKALGATIQALEVQRMTLATLKNMNVSLAEVADAFKIRPVEPAPVSEPEPEPEAAQAASEPEPEAAAPAVDPMLWWNALTQQFQEIAGNVVRDMADQASRAAEQMAQASAEAAGQAPAPEPAATPAKRPPRKTPVKRAKPSAGRKTPVKAPARERSS